MALAKKQRRSKEKVRLDPYILSGEKSLSKTKTGIRFETGMKKLVGQTQRWLDNMLNTTEFRNFILRSIDKENLQYLQDYLQPVVLPHRFRLIEQGRPADWVYFPENGIASVIVRKDGLTQEAGMFGREGATSIFTALASANPTLSVVMQVVGSGHRIQMRHMEALMEECHDLKRLLMDYALSAFSQVMETAMANTQLNTVQRLARWLLMIMDRLKMQSFRITHDYLSLMIGVSRPCVTVALQDLVGKGLIRNTRGAIHIEEPVGLHLLTRNLVTSIEVKPVPHNVPNAASHRPRAADHGTSSTRSDAV